MGKAVRLTVEEAVKLGYIKDPVREQEERIAAAYAAIEEANKFTWKFEWQYVTYSIIAGAAFLLGYLAGLLERSL